MALGRKKDESLSRKKKNSPEGGSPSPATEKDVAAAAGASSNPSVAETKKPAIRHVRENLEAVGVAIILALIIRHFSLEAFEIPTGSMAPGLNGIHVESTCPNCNTESNVGLHTDSDTGQVHGTWRSGPIYEGPCASCGASIEALIDGSSTVYCPGCGPQPVDKKYIRQSKAHSFFDAWCPECGLTYTEILEPGDVVSGHKILVNKFVRYLREPKRWEVIVFKFNRKRNYIKRLIGLPGEEIQVKDGDIWINNAIERKPEWAQDALWFPVHDSDVVERGLVDLKPWKSDDDSLWNLPKFGDEERDITFDARGGKTRVSYTRRIVNQYSYNAAANRQFGTIDHRAKEMVQDSRVPELGRDWWIRDLRIMATVTAGAGTGFIHLEVDNDPLRYRVQIPVGNASGDAQFEVTHLRTGKTTHLATIENLEPLQLTREYELDFYLADRALTLRVDGDVVGTPYEIDVSSATHQLGPRPKGTVGATAEGVQGTFSRVQIFRDIHYTRGGANFDHGTRGPFPIPENGYFAMGDNSPSSLDSRSWAIVPEENMLGQAFWIFWPAYPGRFQMGFIR